MKMFSNTFKKDKGKSTDISRGLLDGDGIESTVNPVNIFGSSSNNNNPTPVPTDDPLDSRDSTSAYLPFSSEHGNDKPKSARHKKIVDENYSYDFCLVVPNPEDDKFKSEPIADNYIPVSEILERLHLVGLETYQFYSGDSDEIYIKIRAPLQILRSHAENMKLKMLLDSNYLKKHVENIKAPIGQDPLLTKISPYEFIYGSYDDGRSLVSFSLLIFMYGLFKIYFVIFCFFVYLLGKRSMFAKASGYAHPFSSVLRIKLLFDIITNDEDDCCSLNLRQILKDGSRTLLSYYPLHDEGVRTDLTLNWLAFKVLPWQQPLYDVKEYLGEKVTLYFAFTGHYTTWLVSLSVASSMVIVYFFALMVMEGNLINALNKGFMIPFFCIFVAVWAQLMLEYWKRKQNRLAMEWGQTEFEEEEDCRPEFQATVMRCVT
jgi:hypothetical protein